MSCIRNFSIIAHIDHGKSTLADKFISLCGGLAQREMQEQVLDTLELERERGITIKAQAVRLKYKAKDSTDWLLNMIDTPGHADFAYEVSRSLSACQLAVLVVDATQGVQAQTVAHCYRAIEEDITILPVLNKVDMSTADPERVKQEIEDLIGIDASQALLISAKSGQGVQELMEQIVTIPLKEDAATDPTTKALIIDSWFDNYTGVNSLVYIKQGRLKKNSKIKVFSTNRTHDLTNIYVNQPKRHFVDALEQGEVGVITASIKEIQAAPTGDTILLSDADLDVAPLAGFKPTQPQVFASIYPIQGDEFEKFRVALEKLKLNDAALEVEPISSETMGAGFRCGFLGSLHMEVTSQRLEREYDLDLVTTAPNVSYRALKKNDEYVNIASSDDFPNPSGVAFFEEPTANVLVLSGKDYVGPIVQLLMEKRGRQKNMRYYGTQVEIEFSMPLSEIITDFAGRLKSITRGFASYSYSVEGYQPVSLVKISILINGKEVDALSDICTRAKSQSRGREITEKLAEIIPRQMFEVAVQAAIGGKIIARSTVRAARKNVTAKCYGGDITRKKKLLEKQKAGKKRMKMIGQIALPKESFIKVLSTDQ